MEINTNLIDVFTSAVLRAKRLHAQERGVQPDPAKMLPYLEQYITEQYQAVVDAGREATGGDPDAYRMVPDWMWRDLINAHANMAAVKALDAAGYTKE